MPPAPPSSLVIGLALVGGAALVSSLLAFFMSRRATGHPARLPRRAVKGALVVACVIAAAALAGAGLLSGFSLRHLPRAIHWIGLYALMLSLPAGLFAIALDLWAVLSLVKAPDATRKEWLMLSAASALCMLPYAIVLPTCL